MTLRIAIGKLTTLVVPWSAQEAAELAQASLSRTRAYLSHLVKHGVVVPAGTDLWRAGPRAQVWRAQPAPDGPSYGNSADYRRQRDTFDKIKLRDWNARRAGAKEPTEAVASGLAGLASLTYKDLQGDTRTSKDIQNTAMATALRVDQVAEALGCHPNTVRNLIAAGRIKAFRLTTRGFRVAVEEIEAFKQRNETNRVG